METKGAEIHPSAKKTRIVALIAICLISVGVYVGIAAYPRIPDFPFCEIDRNLQLRATEALNQRVRGFTPSREEKDLVARLEQIHRMEASATKPLSSPHSADLAAKIADLRNRAASMANLDRVRYLHLGDYLANHFAKALSKFLAAARSGKSGNDIRNYPEGVRVIQSGGSFVTNALRTGAIGTDGILHVPKWTPPVLFRVRWRHFAELRLDLGFTDVEKALFYEFVARYADASSLERRLTSIKELKRVCPSFNAATARALAMRDAGENHRARKELRREIQAGRATSETRGFIRALK